LFGSVPLTKLDMIALQKRKNCKDWNLSKYLF
jgi:hypothetical protein